MTRKNKMKLLREKRSNRLSSYVADIRSTLILVAFRQEMVEGKGQKVIGVRKLKARVPQYYGV
jgi:hypothetical protein